MKRLFALAALFGFGFLASSLIFGSPVSAAPVSLAMFTPLAAMTPDVGKAGLPRVGAAVEHRSLLKPFQGRPAVTRDLEAKAVREALTPINPVS